MLLILYHDTNAQAVHTCIGSTAAFMVHIIHTNVSVLLYVQVKYVYKVVRVRINRVRLSNLLVVS